MKRVLMAAAALAALGVAGTAVAHDSVKVLTVRGFAPAQCHIHAPSTFVRLHSDALVDHDGFVRHSLADSIANGLDGLGVDAWCTGNHNAVNLVRTSLVNQVHRGEHGFGTTDAGGFDTAATYELAVNIDGATRRDHVTPLEGSSDGIGNGPGMGVGANTSVTDFGPHGHGAHVRFLAESGFTPSAISGANHGAFDVGPSSDFHTDNARLAAGPYQGYVTLILRPGI